VASLRDTIFCICNYDAGRANKVSSVSPSEILFGSLLAIIALHIAAYTCLTDEASCLLKLIQEPLFITHFSEKGSNALILV